MGTTLTMVIVIVVFILLALFPHCIVGWAASTKMRSFWRWTILSSVLCNITGGIELLFGGIGISALIIFIVLLIIALQPSDEYRRKKIIEEEEFRAAIREDHEKHTNLHDNISNRNSTGKTINDLYKQ